MIDSDDHADFISRHDESASILNGIDEFNSNSHVVTSLPAKNSMEGFLQKWTNYVYGWQRRYVILSNGTLSYTLDPNEVNTSFQGVVFLSKAHFKVHSKDELRFDVVCPNISYYFRADTPESRVIWVNKLISEREVSTDCYSSKRSSSMVSVSSASSVSSLVSGSSRRASQLSDLVHELHQVKEHLFQQIDNLQGYFDLISSFTQQSDDGSNLNYDDDSDTTRQMEMSIDQALRYDAPISLNNTRNFIAPGVVMPRQIGHRYTKSSSCTPLEKTMPLLGLKDRISLQRFLNKKKINLQNEVSQFRTTTVGVMSAISSCIEMIESTEQSFHNDLSKERDNNKKLMKKIKDLTNELERQKAMSGPDAIEGPGNKLLDEEFYDALETAISSHGGMSQLSDQVVETEETKNPYKQQLDEFRAESIVFLTSPQDSSWTLSLDNQPTKIYKKEVVLNDIVVDPYKVIHLYKGFTAQELCTFFWDTKYRLLTDNTVDYVFVKATYGDNTIVVHQLHKHIWPASRRDSCFVSVIDEITDPGISKSLASIFSDEYKQIEGYRPDGNSWMVTNMSVDHPGVSAENCVRVDARVAIIAQTFVSDSKKS